MNKREEMIKAVVESVIEYYDDWRDDSRLYKVAKALRQIFPSYIVAIEYGSINASDILGIGKNYVQVRDKVYSSDDDYVSVTRSMTAIVDHVAYDRYLDERELHYNDPDDFEWLWTAPNGELVRTKA